MAPSTSKSKSSEPPKKKARKSKVESSEEGELSSGAESDSSSSKAKVKAKAKTKGKAKSTSKENGKGKKATKKNGGGKSETKNDDVSASRKGKRKAKAESDGEDEFINDDEDEKDSAEEDEEDEDDGGKNTRVVKSIKKVAAPKTKADTSVILPTTMSFLLELRSHNDRDWFEENKERYLHANTNFKSFVTAWVPKASEVDWQLPHLPVKDLVHRIYRDVRFSKDKTPYKTNLSISHSRTGRKGPFAFYYFHISPGGRSILAAGCWKPDTNELKAIRQAILDNPKRLRDVIAEKEFVELYGKPESMKDGGRRSIFGREDQLKNAPKLEGVDKTHPDIDLLKCRSFAVESHFTDEEVVAEDFLVKVLDKMRITVPFVHLLNEFISPSPPSDDEDEEEEEEVGGYDPSGEHAGEGDDDQGGEDEEEEDEE
ncbi:DUF2461 domain-containing protein [Sporobolomyces salmoneus]|uniref:DUF2461 domain-containing protein n=1 Tax=Sporobolomyces salmoneus TaxID=183962 RepID=UPI003179B795